MEFLPTTGFQWVSAIFTIVAGVFAAYKVYKMGVDSKTRDALSSLETEVASLSRRLKTTEDELIKIKSERDAYFQVISATDKESREFRQMMIKSSEAVLAAKEQILLNGQKMDQLILAGQKSEERMLKNIERIFLLLEKRLRDGGNQI